MSESIPTDDEKRLADRLKREARATRPVFSEALHERICQAIRQSEPPEPRRPARWRLPYPWLPAAVAATLLGSISLAAWWLLRPPGAVPRPVPVEIAVVPEADPVVDPDMITDPTGDAAEQIGMLVDSTLTTGQWAYLDHDARLAVQLLVGQLPFDVESIE